MPYKFIVRFLLLLCLGLTEKVIGQEQSTYPAQQDAYKSFDALLGIANSGIANGREYIEAHRMINEKHKFFKTEDFLPGAVRYDGQSFFDIPLRYNIFEDQLSVALQMNGRTFKYVLFPNQLEGFKVKGTEFINFYKPGSAQSGIYELLYQDSQVQVLKKHRLKEKTHTSRDYLFHEFKEKKPRYFFLTQGEPLALNRRNLLASFPGQKSSLKKSYRRFKRKSKEEKDQMAIAIFQELSPTP